MDIRAQTIITRFDYSDISTIGDLIVDKGIFACNTLEDTCRRDLNNDGLLQADEKVYGRTAIPYGLYRMVLDKSPKFGFCPWILDVPFFKDIRIHPGNQEKDSLGCILVGHYNKNQKDWIGESRSTFKALMDVLIPMSKREPLWIEIIGGLRADQIGG